MPKLNQLLNLNIDYPVIQAPMAGVQDSALVIAVAQAGGMGSLPCAMLTADKIHEEVNLIRSKTSRSFNLNFFCHKNPQQDEQKQRAWLNTLSPYFEEFEIDQSIVSSASARLPFDQNTANALEKLKPEIISFHFGLPNDDLLPQVKSWGTKIFSSATTLEEAFWLENKGVDAIIAQGIEAGGHRGIFLSEDLSSQVAGTELLKQLVKETNLPIIAAGGIATSNEVRKAFELGASAVQVGTSFLRCTEATTTEIHRAALVNEAANNTEITNLFTGRPARAIRNRLINDLGAIGQDLPDFPATANALLPLRSHAQKLGLGDFSAMWSGTNPNGCKAVPAADILAELVIGIPNE